MSGVGQRSPGQVGMSAVMPTLSRGAHRRVNDGACVMEYVSVLAGLRFSDHPRCTHPALAQLARSVNDRVGADRTRHQLALLAPALMATATADPRITVAVVNACLRSAAIAHTADPAASPHRFPTRRVAHVRARSMRLERSRWARFLARSVELWGFPSTTATQVRWALNVLQRCTAHLDAHKRDAVLVALLADTLEDCRYLITHPVNVSSAQTVTGSPQ